MSDSEFMAALKAAAPVAGEALDLGDEPCGLVVVDEVNGFATAGAGNLAPRAPDPAVDRMISETDRLARAFAARGWPILAFLDSHPPGIPEPPYPPHCEIGTGEENLVPALAWLEGEGAATLIRKDCINGFVGAFAPDGSNRAVDWLNGHGLRRILVVGICTDICVMDFVLTLLSARNHGMAPALRDIFVYRDGCATFDLDAGAVAELGLPENARHPRDLTHHMGLYFMAARGARLVDEVRL